MARDSKQTLALAQATPAATNVAAGRGPSKVNITDDTRKPPEKNDKQNLEKRDDVLSSFLATFCRESAPKLRARKGHGPLGKLAHLKTMQEKYGGDMKKAERHQRDLLGIHDKPEDVFVKEEESDDQTEDSK